MSQNTYATTLDNGKGVRHGVVSELSAFLTIKPGKADLEAIRSGANTYVERIARYRTELRRLD